MRPIRWLIVASLLTGAAPVPGRADTPGDLARAYVAAHSLSSAAMAHGGVPSFARQTGLACSACHYQFLQLTPFGRKFKLNGYTLTAQQLLIEKEPANGGALALSPIPLVSAMLTASVTHLGDAQPGVQNDAAMFPQELSVFLAGQITSKVGVFSQFTYGGADGAFGMDNLDVRYANKTQVGGSTEMVYGLTLHNNPTIQDLWNTTPAWGYPFNGSEGAPTGAAATVLDGALSGNVLGLGGYTMLGNTVYGELSGYRSALQGFAAPEDATGAIHGVAPYWRFSLQKEWDTRYLMVGTYGLHVSEFPDVLSGPRNTFTDIGVDAQFETRVGAGNFVARGTWLHEKQKLDATFAAGGSDNTENTLKTLRMNGSYYPKQWMGLTAGYFQTTGTVDATLYSGSATGDPKTTGFIGELDFNPWENTRLGVQYTGYGKFDGGSTNYDGSGRNASDNNTLYLFAWLVF